MNAGYWRWRCAFCHWFFDFPTMVLASIVDEELTWHLDSHVQEMVAEVRQAAW